MTDEHRDLTKQTVIVNKLGLHARAATKIVEIAKSATSNVWLIKDEEMVDAQSVIDILTLACGEGTSIAIRVESHNDKHILDKIVELVNNGFGE